VADAYGRILSKAQTQAGNIVKELLLDNARVILPTGIMRGGALIRDGRIAQIFSASERAAGINDRIDLAGVYLAPGLIDIHIHGSVGVDVQNADEAELRRLSEFLLSEGVTRYFATFVPADEKDYREAIQRVANYIEQQGGASQRVCQSQAMRRAPSPLFQNLRRRCALAKSFRYRCRVPYSCDPCA
jgi:hypothetical protein